MLSAEARSNICRNYRDQFKAQTNTDFNGSDDYIIQCWEANSGAGTASECDAWVIDDMKDFMFLN